MKKKRRGGNVLLEKYGPKYFSKLSLRKADLDRRGRKLLELSEKKKKK